MRSGPRVKHGKVLGVFRVTDRGCGRRFVFKDVISQEVTYDIAWNVQHKERSFRRRVSLSLMAKLG